MKTFKLLKSAILVNVLFSSLVLAAPQIGRSQGGRQYLISSDALHNWSIGAYVSESRRDVRVRGQNNQMKSKSSGVYVGYDVLRWATVFGIAGLSNTSFNHRYSSSHNELGLSLQLNLIDHELMDPTVMENRLRLNLQTSYMWHKADYPGGSVAWGDLSTGLMFSVVNDTPSFKVFWVENIALFGGPVYSKLIGSNLSERSNVGYAAGIEVGVSEKVSLLAGIKDIDRTSAMGSITVRF